MRKFIYIAVLIVSGVFTSCTDTTEEDVLEPVERRSRDTGGEDGYTSAGDDDD